MQSVKDDVAIALQPESSAIAGITEPSLINYFETFNVGDFEATSQQFAVNGALHPPFESVIEGRDAIADYLKVEAKGITAQPQQGVIKQVLEDGCPEIEVTGRVQTPWFGVNVAWLFTLNSQQEITFLKVKLIASPQELLKLRR
ncbi:nuclear transport factor 2 [Phormidesmis priestleyi ULC007]|uniref:Nuclear transport factor 2 n=1 Tax=Phormidesmis priestleyi ULC007 TaxID=1920490 RepID=A0A2T1D4S2_9CYAN|nr:nuclear transport factor 2 family protein [Phormidesmis priestleyi]PSB15479.1 nuclear transport factor 2 [Phormidesmis priestleyi ULC007]PZO46156.1 MAG: nuclear transport factor 2 [Phormidesmis priestleyi]